MSFQTLKQSELLLYLLWTINNSLLEIKKKKDHFNYLKTKYSVLGKLDSFFLFKLDLLKEKKSKTILAETIRRILLGSKVATFLSYMTLLELCFRSPTQTWTSEQHAVCSAQLWPRALPRWPSAPRGSHCPCSSVVSVTADKFNETGHSQCRTGTRPCYSCPSWFVELQSLSPSGSPGVLGFKEWLKHTLAVIVQAAKAHLDTEHEAAFRFTPQMFILKLSKATDVYSPIEQVLLQVENALFLGCFTLHPLTHFFMNYIGEGKRRREHLREELTQAQIQTEQNGVHAPTGSLRCVLHRSFPFQAWSQYLRKKFISLQPCDSIGIN